MEGHWARYVPGHGWQTPREEDAMLVISGIADPMRIYTSDINILMHRAEESAQGDILPSFRLLSP